NNTKENQTLTVWTTGAETGLTVDRRLPTLSSLSLLAMTGVTPGFFGVHRKDPSPPPCPGDRACQLEERLSSQERTTAFLLHQTFRIKDNIVSCLQGSKGYQHGETAARQLLENHVQTITSIVKKLSQDIEVIRAEERFPALRVETGTCLQPLSSPPCTGFRLWFDHRCEASIAKLSEDIRIIRCEAQKTDKEIYGLHSALKTCVGDFEKKVMQLLGKIETSNSDQSSNLKTVQGEQHHKLQLLDFKLTSIVSDFRDQIQTHQKWTEVQQARSEEDQAQHRQQLLNSVKERLERAEKTVEEKLLLLSLKLEQTYKPQKYEKQLNQMRTDEKNLHARITRFERQIWKELEEIQNEYRSGEDGNLLFQKILSSKDRETLKLLFLSPNLQRRRCMG
uniref:Family with sequence similarity 81 member B n=1 Tax=Falco tinnunculus TaxID=100819 RepID=A0A8C4TSV2_FALTI